MRLWARYPMWQEARWAIKTERFGTGRWRIAHLPDERYPKCDFALCLLDPEESDVGYMDPETGVVIEDGGR